MAYTDHGSRWLSALHTHRDACLYLQGESCRYANINAAYNGFLQCCTDIMSSEYLNLVLMTTVIAEGISLILSQRHRLLLYPKLKKNKLYKSNLAQVQYSKVGGQLGGVGQIKASDCGGKCNSRSGRRHREQSKLTLLFSKPIQLGFISPSLPRLGENFCFFL